MRRCSSADGMIRRSPARPGTDARIFMRNAFTPVLHGLAVCALAGTAWGQGTVPAKPKAADGSGGSARISSLGAAKTGAKLLSREELRACLKQQSELAARKAPIEAQREKLQAERQALLQADESLTQERVALDRLAEASTGINKRFQELSAQVDDFNARVAKFQDSGRSGPTAERQRNEFEREKQALELSSQALEAERAELRPKAEQALKSYNTRAAARQQAAAEWNAQNASQVQSAQAYEIDRENWAADCAGRVRKITPCKIGHQIKRGISTTRGSVKNSFK